MTTRRPIGGSYSHQKNVLDSQREKLHNYSQSKSSNSTMRLPSLPIYQLLKAFNLQQYTLKLEEKGYSKDVYKLALLTKQGREDLIEQL